MPLPEPPEITLAIVRDRTPEARATGGFLNLRRVDVTASFPGGETSTPFAYDMCERAALDAVVVVAHFAVNGVRHVFLRSCVRPPVAFRRARGSEPKDRPHPQPFPRGGGGREQEQTTSEACFWEVAAGLIDPGETPAEAGARELGEELGLRIAPADLHELGPFTYPAPAVIGERHVYFHIEVDPDARTTPTEDGSVLERGASIVRLPLSEALGYAREGRLRDAKTELALRRLAELVR